MVPGSHASGSGCHTTSGSIALMAGRRLEVVIAASKSVNNWSRSKLIRLQPFKRTRSADFDRN